MRKVKVFLKYYQKPRPKFLPQRFSQKLKRPGADKIPSNIELKPLIKDLLKKKPFKKHHEVLEDKNIQDPINMASKEQYCKDSLNRIQAGSEQLKYTTSVEKDAHSIDEEPQDLLAVTIHSLNHVDQSALVLSSPLVLVYVCDAENGNLLCNLSKKDSSNGHEVSPSNPLFTWPFCSKENSTLYYQWEETLFFKIKISAITDPSTTALLIFDIKDFISRPQIPYKVPNLEWGTAMWAFLKVRHSHNSYNIGKRLRLQMFKPRKDRDVTFSDVYSWWKSGHRRKFASSFYVTLDSALPPKIPSKVLGVKQEDLTQTDADTSIVVHANLSFTDAPSSTGKFEWNRKLGEQCQIPNNIKHKFSVKDEGCMVVKFSNDGLKLACGARNDILVYNIFSSNLLHCFQGHSNIIYDFDWAAKNDQLMSCSSDSTVRIWSLHKQPQQFLQILAHPSYVYCCKFFPDSTSYVISGCFDCILRVWHKQGTKYRVIQELNQHLGYISSVCFSIDYKYAFSGDKQGIIAVWKIKPPSKQKERFTLESLLKLPDLLGESINCLIPHPGGHRMVVHTRDSQIMLLNLNHLTVVQKLQGHLNMKKRILSCVSPCGSWVLSGSEDGNLFIWNSDDGEVFHSIDELLYRETISCVDFHPFEHMIAISSHEEGSSVLLMNYEKKVALNAPVSVQPVCTPTDKVDRMQPPFQEFPSPLKFRQSYLETSLPPERWDKAVKDIVTKLDVILNMSPQSQLQSIPEEKSKNYPVGIALYEFRASAADEMDLKKDELVSIIKKKTADWWLVANELGNEGLVPSSYLAEKNKSTSKIFRSTDLFKAITTSTSPSSEFSKSEARLRRHMALKRSS